MFVALAIVAPACDAPAEPQADCAVVTEPATAEAPAAEDILPVLLAYNPVEVAWDRAASGDARSPVLVVTARAGRSTEQLRLEGPRCGLVGVARLFPVRLDIDIGDGHARGAVEVSFAAFAAELAEIHARESSRGPAELSPEWEDAATAQWDFVDGEWNIEIGGGLAALDVGVTTRTDRSVSSHWSGTLLTQ